MLKGIDISNWQSELVIADNIDFVIAKATEGLNFVDKYCDKFIQRAIKLDKLFGFYHFARNNKPAAEAAFFVSNCRGYFNHGIPILDIEDFSIQNWDWYASTFCDTVYDATGVYPLIYCSASQCYRFTNACKKSGLWVAGYPAKYTGFIDKNMPYNILPWQYYCIWQFTDCLKYKDANGNTFSIDANIAAIDKAQWLKYACAKNETKTPITQKGKLTEEEIKKLMQAVKNEAEKL